ncbi:S100P-binding protein isoform X2 [Elgaria multicarinata webbii]|uniref:S100P-binding protein isoform X2 n=1 Tax=Elgaria multicarinata webbii TaxID=159646 RepID=UPI002FCD5A93
MASHTFRSCTFGLHCDLKVTFLNDSVPRSKRHLEEFEDGNRADVKRQRYMKSCSSSSLLPSFHSSPSNGIATSPICSVATSGCCVDSDDDALLEPSFGEKLDSPTGLSLEAEEKLLSDDLETSPNSIVYGLNTQKVESVSMLASLKVAQLPRALDKTGPSASSSSGDACKKHFGNLASESYLNKRFQNQAGLGLGSNSPMVAEAAPVIEAASLSEDENVVSGVTDKAVREDSQAASQQTAEHASTNAVAEGLSEGQAFTKQNERGGHSTNDLPHEAEGESASASSRGEAAPPNSVSDRREARVEDPSAKEPKRPKRICIQEADLESSKEKYIYAVLNHASRAAPAIEIMLREATAQPSDSALASGLTGATATSVGLTLSLIALSAVRS